MSNKKEDLTTEQVVANMDINQVIKYAGLDLRPNNNGGSGHSDYVLEIINEARRVLKRKGLPFSITQYKKVQVGY